jgi:hypothetical protein
MKDVKLFAEELSDAYSTDRYRNGWAGCIRMLRKRGYTDREIEAIIRSKHTRWAGDSSDKPYGKVTSVDLARYMDHSSLDWPLEARKLINGTA